MKQFLFTSLFILIFNGFAWAQPFNMNPDIEPYEIKLKPYNPTSGQPELAKGMMGYLDIKQDQDTAYFFVRGISIFSPVFVNVSSSDPAEKVRVQLHKINWEHALKSGTTDDKGSWNDSFKTEGDFGIMVIPQSLPTNYTLLVWAGDEVKSELPTVFKKRGDAVGDSSENSKAKSEGSPWLYLIIGFLLAVVGLLAFKVLKKKKS